MKKFLFLILCICMAAATLASTTERFEFEYEEQGITIIFEEDTIFTNDKRQSVADFLALENENMDGISTYAWCWLTGHDLISDSVVEIQHKVSPTVPRCYETIYEVITCSKCDHMQTNKLSSVFIPCCPED